MKIYILRHGETALNKSGVIQGWLNVNEPLNENGRKLAVLTGQAMKGIRFDRCISSPFTRAKETAEIILRESGNALEIEYNDRIREINFGDQEGKNLSEMGDERDLFLSDPFSVPRFLNGESVRDVCERTQSFLKEILSQDDGKVYLVVTHGVALRAMINYLKDDPSDFWNGHAPYNCSVTIIETENGTPRITAVDKVYYDRSLLVDHFKN